MECMFYEDICGCYICICDMTCYIKFLELDGLISIIILLNNILSLLEGYLRVVNLFQLMIPWIMEAISHKC